MKPLFLTLLLPVALTWSACRCCPPGAVVDVTRLGAVPNDGQDDTAAFVAAFHEAQTRGVKVIRIPQGRYNLRAGGDCLQANLGSPNPLFSLTHLDGLTIHGEDAELMMSGNATLFAFRECKNITVEGVTVDWERPPFSQGTVIATAPGYFDVQVESGFPVQGGEPVPAIVGYDPVSRLPASLDRSEVIERTELIRPQVLRVHLKKILPAWEQNVTMSVGMLLVLRHQVGGFGPLIIFTRCADVRVSNVTVYTAPSMGVFGSACTNISLNRYNVLIRPGSRRLMSTTCDATHFNSCKGTVSLADCTFEGMGDDGVNINSGFYLTVLQRLDDHTVLCERYDLPNAGDVMEMSHPDTLLPFSTEEVKSASLEPGTNTLGLLRIAFKNPLPDGLREDDFLANASRVAKLRMRHCTVRANRARGVLCQTRDAVIEDCVFRNCTSAGVLVLTDAGWYYESIGARNVTVRNNRFENCNQGAATAEGALAAVVWLKDRSYPPQAGVHQDVCFEGNQIMGSANSGIFAVGVEGLTIRNNTIEQACLKPTCESGRNALCVTNCARVTVAGNTIDPKKQGDGMAEAVRVTDAEAAKP